MRGDVHFIYFYNLVKSIMLSSPTCLLITENTGFSHSSFCRLLIETTTYNTTLTKHCKIYSYLSNTKHVFRHTMIGHYSPKQLWLALSQYVYTQNSFQYYILFQKVYKKVRNSFTNKLNVKNHLQFILKSKHFLEINEKPYF